MTCLDDGILRSRLDGELVGAELKEVDQHLATCNDCRAHFEKLDKDTAQTRDLLTSLSPNGSNSANPAVAYAQFGNQFGTAAKRKPSWASQLFAPSWRPVWGLLTVAVVIAMLISVDPVRGWSQRILALLRVQKIAVVSIDPATLMSGSETDPKPYKLINQFFSDNVIVTVDPGKPTLFPSISKAAQVAGFPVRTIGSLGAPQAVLVRGETAFQMTVNRNRVETLLNEIGRSDIQVPESANGALIAVQIPKIVVSTYGDCPAPIADTREQVQAGRKPRQLIKLNANCTYLVQAGSPTISVPPNLNMSEIAEATLQLAGMSASEAHSFCQTVDWSSTMVVPIPRNSSSHETVAVDGVEGTLITENLSEGNRYSLLWVKNGVVHSLAGSGSASDALALAASLR